MAWGAVSPQEAAHLGDDLTPLGGEKAANADGSIPAWTGGIKSAADAGFPELQVRRPSPRSVRERQAAVHHHHGQLAQYAAKLTEGHKALLQDLPRLQDGWSTRRIAAPSAPQRIYDAHQAHRDDREARCRTATVSPARSEAFRFRFRRRASRCSGITCCAIAAIAAARQVGQVPMTAGGSYTLVNFKEEFLFPYYVPGMTEAGAGQRASCTSCRRPPRRRAWPVRCCWCRRRSTSRRRIAPRLDLQPRAAPRAPRAATWPSTIRAPTRTTCAPIRPVRHVQRQPAALRLEAGRQEGDVRPVQLLPAAERASSSTATLLHEEPHQPGPTRATSCTGCGSWTRR